MKCVSCGEEVAAGEKFCTGCGEAAPEVAAQGDRFCTHCGATLEPGLKFCTDCGELVAPPPTPGDMEKQGQAASKPTAPPQPAPQHAAPPPVAPAPVAPPPVAPPPIATQPAPPSRGAGSKVALVGVALVVIGGAVFLLRPGVEKQPASAPVVAAVQPAPVPTPPQADAPAAPAATPAPVAGDPPAPDTGATQTTTSPSLRASASSGRALLDIAVLGDAARLQAAVDELKAKPKPATGDRKAARQLNEKGLAALRADQDAEAVDLLTSATRLDPADSEVADNLGFALRVLGRYEESEAQLLKVLEQWPDRGFAWANLAETSSYLGKSNQAVAAYIVAHRFSRNPDRALEAMQRMADDAPDQRVRDDLRTAIRKIQAAR